MYDPFIDTTVNTPSGGHVTEFVGHESLDCMLLQLATFHLPLLERRPVDTLGLIGIVHQWKPKGVQCARSFAWILLELLYHLLDGDVFRSAFWSRFRSDLAVWFRTGRLYSILEEWNDALGCRSLLYSTHRGTELWNDERLVVSSALRNVFCSCS